MQCVNIELTNPFHINTNPGVGRATCECLNAITDPKRAFTSERNACAFRRALRDFGRRVACGCGFLQLCVECESEFLLCSLHQLDSQLATVIDLAVLATTKVIDSSHSLTLAPLVGAIR
jgi:hypothetical protein